MNPFQAPRTFSLVLASAGMALGVSRVFFAWQDASLPAVAAAVALLLGCPAIALFAVLSPPPEPAPLELQRRSDRALILVRPVRSHIFATGWYVLVLWFCQLGGLIAAPQSPCTSPWRPP
jgi:hypothetical protein